MQYMMPNDMGVSTAATEVAIHMAMASAPYLAARLTLLRDWLTIHPARNRNVQLMEERQISCRGVPANQGKLNP